jgi:hypothetical protein
MLSLAELAAHQAITDHIYRYCRAVDRLDVPLGHAIWHPGGIADYGDYYHGPGPGVIDLICENHRSLLHHSHQVTNIIIELRDDTAGSESYCTASLRLQQGDRLMHMMVWSRYVDSWSYRGGRWALDKRIAIRDFDEIRDVTPMQQHAVGTRDRNDPSYAVLRSPA